MRKIILKALFLVLLGFLVFFIVNGVLENISINSKISDFMKKGVCEEEIIHHPNGDIILCKVPRETSKENDVNKESIKITQNNIYLGSVGDIIVRKSSPFGNIPFLNEFVSYFIGGHAGLISSDSKKSIEVAGTTDDNYVREIENGWIYTQNPIIGLRVKGATIVDYESSCQKAKSYIGDKYNYSFIFNTKEKHYCSDLVSKAWNPFCALNDGFVTTINDLICSPNTYIFLYKYVDGNNVTHIYYLE